VIPYVAQRERAEDGISDRMQSNVSIRVPVEARLSGYCPPTEFERPPRSEPVHVKPLTDSHVLQDTAPLIARTTWRSASVVTLGFG